MSNYTTVSSVCVTDSEEDDFSATHTASNPYCDDYQCSCHINTAYHEAIHHREATADEIEDIYAFLELEVA